MTTAVPLFRRPDQQQPWHWRPVYARKLFDIRWRGIAHAVYAAVRPSSASRGEECIAQAEKLWAPQQTLVALCVRSAFDLFLLACSFPKGTEVIMSAVTVPDMARIVRAHGLVPIPVDLEDDATVSASAVEALITPRTKAIVIAQLFGACSPLGEIGQLARGNGIVLVEDCAQGFRGLGFIGSPDATVSLFSFGPIKTCTSFGGALATVRDKGLLHQMKMAQLRHPQQTAGAFFKRVIKYSVFKLVTGSSYLYGLLVAILKWTGKSPDTMITRWSHSLASGTALLPQLRLRPSTALVETMTYQITHFEPESLKRRTERIESIAASCSERLRPLAFARHESGQARHHYWICPVIIEDPIVIQEVLLGSGFDAASGKASLAAIDPDDAGSCTASSGFISKPTKASWLLDHIVYLPVDHEFDMKMKANLVNALEAGAARSVSFGCDDGVAFRPPIDKEARLK